MRSERTRVLVEIALAAALGGVFHVVSIQLPINVAGGEIAFTMLPIVVVALRRGVGAGVACGILVGVIGLLYKPYIVHPAQVVLDYPLAFGLVGLSGLLARPVKTALASRRRSIGMGLAAVAVVFGGLARLAAHFVSGIVFFGSSAPEGQPVWLYSIMYNATYMLPSIVISAVAAAVLLPVLERAVPSSRQEA